jgi:hypothetical protein
VRRFSVASAACALAIFTQLSAPAYADATSQAQRIYERIAGVPPSASVLQTMVGKITATPGTQGLINAAAVATDPANAPSFYNVTLKNFVAPATNRDQSVFVPLNDYMATVIGMVRDDVPFNTVLSDDILYTVQGVSPAPSISANDHYAAAETNGVDLSAKLTRSTQSGTYGLPPEATSGVWTTRGGASAFFIAGTNRAQFRFTMVNYMCRDMELLEDTTRPTDRIRQDVARSPGGDSRVFLNNCVGCHSGMDPMAQAFAFYNFDTTVGSSGGALVYTANMVQPKYLINSDNFKPGFVTPDNSWQNRWRTGPNSSLGWSPTSPGSGTGAKSLGQEIAASDAFAECQVVKVYRAVCFRTPTTTEASAVATIKTNFKNGYSLKQVFQQVAANCAGQ